MRCALSFDENKDLIEQNLAAWGEMQSLKDEPAYKEEEITDNEDKAFFRGVKMAMDAVIVDLENAVVDEIISKDANEHLQSLIAGELAMHLFSILDNQEE